MNWKQKQLVVTRSPSFLFSVPDLPPCQNISLFLFVFVLLPIIILYINAVLLLLYLINLNYWVDELILWHELKWICYYWCDILFVKWIENKNNWLSHVHLHFCFLFQIFLLVKISPSPSLSLSSSPSSFYT